MSFDRNHPSIELANDLNNIAKPILTKHNLNYFQYLKVFKNGDFSFTTNSSKWVDFTRERISSTDEKAIYSALPHKENLDTNKYCFLWDHNLPDSITSLARGFNYNNGITFVERFSDHYTMIGFAAPENNSRAVDCYFNNKDELIGFIQKFYDENSYLIETLDKNRISVPKHQQDENLKSMLELEHLKNKITFEGDEIYFTARESDCLRLLSIGHTYKEIAKMLTLSPRTVESYINRAKFRLNISKKSNLVKSYLKFLENINSKSS